MSTFDGIIKEYPLISIDNFQMINFKSTVFFLSHCHTDHMRGLDDDRFFDLLEKRAFSNIYVSDVSEHLLKNDRRYSRLKHYVISLSLEEPAIIVVPDEKGGFHSKVVVTLLPAGHCPGSVMFLIEGHNGRVLYTGDFRLPVGGSARLTKLHEETGKLKSVDSLYIDTTFCQKKFLHFPPREKCRLSLFNLVEQWMQKGPNYIVAFSCPAQYNYEYLFVELFEKFKVKIHVSEHKMKKYKGIKSIEDVVTAVPTDTQIHACFYYKPEESLKSFHFDEGPCVEKDGKPCEHLGRLPCGFHMPDKSFIKVLIIKPCAWSFSGSDGSEELILYNNKTKVHRICFSSHSSLAEVRDMVFYLKPKNIYPNVVENQTEEEILELIYEGTSQKEDSFSLSQPLLGTLKNVMKDDSYSEAGSLPFFDDCYQICPINRHSSTKENSIVESTEQILSECDSSGKSETIEEIMFGIKKINDNSIQPPESVTKDSIQRSERNQVPEKENDDVLKWNCPLFSNDENLDPNSSSGSSQDIFEINSTPGDSEELTPKLNCSPESKTVSKSTFPKNTANLVHSNCKEGIVDRSTLVSEKCSADIEMDCLPKSMAILNQHVKTDHMNQHTFSKSNYIQSEKKIYNPLELLFSETSSDVTPSDFNNNRNSSTPCVTKDSHKTEQIDSSKHCEKKCSISRSSFVESCIEEKPKIPLDSDISWRHSKLIDNNEDKTLSSHSKEEMENEIRNMHIIGKTKHEDSDSEYQSSMEDLAYFCKLINKMTEHDHKEMSGNLIKSASSKHSVCAQRDGITISSVNKEPLLNSNFLIGTSQVPSTSKQTQESKQAKQNLNFPYNQSKYVKVANTSNQTNGPYCNNIPSNPDFVSKRQEPILKNSYPNKSFSQSKNDIDILSSQYHSNLNPLKDISASKFEKSLLKPKKSTNKKAQNYDADDIVILDVIPNKQSSKIEVIDLSSDDDKDCLSIAEQSLLDGTSKCNKSVNGNNEFETLVVSPSLLTSKTNPKELSDKTFIARLGEKTRKRKSDENEYMFIKSLRTEPSVDHAHFFEDVCFDSTPEDLPDPKA